MTDQVPDLPPRGIESDMGAGAPPADSAPEPEFGRAIARNAAANWAGHFVVMVSGFILPRLINDHIGQERLGVWDFGWSTVVYLTLLNIGIASSVNRYVAYYRARQDWDALNRVTSSSTCLFVMTATLATLCTLVLAALLPRILPKSFAPYTNEAQWLLLLLGLATAFSLSLPGFSGVITGYQRYDLAAGIEAGCQIVLLVSIGAALLLGYGLRAMGVLVLANKMLEGGLVVVFAHRVCPHLRLSVRSITRATIWDVTTFGSKIFLVQLSKLVLYQGTSLLVAFFLGPALLAVYARSQALVMHANKFLFNFGRVFIPSASGLESQTQSGALTRLVLQGARYSTVISVPMVLVLTILGEALLSVWMGREFARPAVLAILAIGHLVHQAQVGPFYVLVGINRHGLPSAAIFLSGVVSLGVTAVLLGVAGGGLISVALSVGLSQAVVHLLVPPVVKRAVGISLGRYAASILVPAIRVGGPLALVLVLARVLAPNDYVELGAGLAGGGAVLAFICWRWELPDSLKERIARLVGVSWLKPA